MEVGVIVALPSEGGTRARQGHRSCMQAVPEWQTQHFRTCRDGSTAPQHLSRTLLCPKDYGEIVHYLTACWAILKTSICWRWLRVRFLMISGALLNWIFLFFWHQVHHQCTYTTTSSCSKMTVRPPYDQCFRRTLLGRYLVWWCIMRIRTISIPD